jgi:hypothetical protein
MAPRQVRAVVAVSQRKEPDPDESFGSVDERKMLAHARNWARAVGCVSEPSGDFFDLDE